MARQAIWCGDPDTGLTFIELAMVRADRLTATERACALAKLGRIQDAVTAVGVADEEFSHAQPANDPVYVGYYNAGWHAGGTGHALRTTCVTYAASLKPHERLAGVAELTHRIGSAVALS